MDCVFSNLTFSGHIQIHEDCLRLIRSNNIDEIKKISPTAILNDAVVCCRNNESYDKEIKDPSHGIWGHSESTTTLLGYAAIHGQYEVVKFLMENGCDPKYKPYNVFISALGLMVITGVLDIPVDKKTHDDLVKIFILIASKCPELVDEHIRFYDNYSFLHKSGWIDGASFNQYAHGFMVFMNPQHNLRRFAPMRLLSIAIYYQMNLTATLLINAGANVMYITTPVPIVPGSYLTLHSNPTSRIQMTHQTLWPISPFVIAAQKKSVKLLRTIVKHNPRVVNDSFFYTDDTGRCLEIKAVDMALMEAILIQNLGAIKFLLDCGANMAARNYKYTWTSKYWDCLKSPLCYLAYANDYRLFSIFLHNAHFKPVDCACIRAVGNDPMYWSLYASQRWLSSGDDDERAMIIDNIPEYAQETLSELAIISEISDELGVLPKLPVDIVMEVLGEAMLLQSSRVFWNDAANQ